MRALRQDFLGDKVALLVHRHRPSCDPYVLLTRRDAATYADRATAQTDVMHGQAVFAVGRKQLRTPLEFIVFVVFDRRFNVAVDGPQWLRIGFVKIAVAAISAQHIGQFVHRAFEPVWLCLPRYRIVLADLDDIEWLCLNRLPVLEDADFSTLYEVRIVRVHPELHGRHAARFAVVVRYRDTLRLGRNAEARCRPHVVVAELDIGVVECHISATLNVGRTAFRIIDRLAVDCDTHQVQGQRVLRAELARDARDINTFVVVENCQLIIDNLDCNVRCLTLNEAGVDDVIRMHITAPFVLALTGFKLHVFGDQFHRTTCP